MGLEDEEREKPFIAIFGVEEGESFEGDIVPFMCGKGVLWVGRNDSRFDGGNN